MSVFFSLGSSQKLEKGAVPQNVAAIHVSIGQMAASRSTEIAILRRLLLHPGKGDQGVRFKQASQVRLLIRLFRVPVLIICSRV